MKYKFIPMNEEYAKEIRMWKYDGEYSIYNYEDSEDIMDSRNWETMFAVLDEKDDLVAEVTFYNNDIPYGLENPFEDADMFYGQGMRPELTGKGYGPELITQSLTFGIEKYNYKREYILLDVLSFNKRAFRAYQKAGFEFVNEYTEEYDGETYEFIRMRYRNSKADSM